jgi:hypothetical protein
MNAVKSGSIAMGSPVREPTLKEIRIIEAGIARLTEPYHMRRDHEPMLDLNQFTTTSSHRPERVDLSCRYATRSLLDSAEVVLI